MPPAAACSILGISAFFHDSAASLIVDGKIVAAAQEERFSRRKHDERFPEHASRWCLEEAGLSTEQLDAVVLVRFKKGKIICPHRPRLRRGNRSKRD